jgi:hypothetical protein
MKHTTNKNQTWMRDATSTEGLLNLIKELGDNSDKTMIEIGSFVGESTVLNEPISIIVLSELSPNSFIR